MTYSSVRVSEKERHSEPWVVSSGRSNLWSHSDSFLLNLKIQILECKLLCQWKLCHRNCLASFLSAPVPFGLTFNCLFHFPKIRWDVVTRLPPDVSGQSLSTASAWWIGILPADSKVSISAWVIGDIWWHICQRTGPKSEGGKHEQKSGQLHAAALFLRQTSVETDCCCKKYIEKAALMLAILRFARSLNPCDRWAAWCATDSSEENDGKDM